MLQFSPEENVVLQVAISCLPNEAESPCAPFAGFVFNINACSAAHRDSKDFTVCAVVPFGDFEGGELVFWELGIVLQLRGADIVTFRSERLTHFNLHYIGMRGSLVFHSDGDLKRWVESKNGLL